MATLSYLTTCLFLLGGCLLPFGPACARDNEFIALCYHEVESDSTRTLSQTAIHASDLAAQFAWLKANGYHPISIEQILNARTGGKTLPAKAVLLTFDDGKKDVYTRVFPLLKLFDYPAVIALVGSWSEVPDGDTVDYDGHRLPRNNFISWDEANRMQNSGLVEIASHSFDLHRGITGNPQGSKQPAATTRLYSDGKYESDPDYLERLKKDTLHNRQLLLQKTGKAPRVMVWPYGRSNLASQQVAIEAGMPVNLTLIDGVNTAATPLSQLKRHLIEHSPSLQSFAESIRAVWASDPARSVVVTPSDWPDIETGLSAKLDQLQHLAVNVSFIDPRYFSNQAETILFQGSGRNTVYDDLNWISWQIERRAGSAVFVSIPESWLNDDQLLGDLARHVNFSGVRLPLAPDDSRVNRIMAILTQWCWPLRIAYAPTTFDSPLPDWNNMRSDDLLVIPSSSFPNLYIQRRKARQMLVEFNTESESREKIAADMRQLEARGFHQFGVSGMPGNGFEPVWQILSLRSQPLLP